jgi:hypothetical protein
MLYRPLKPILFVAAMLGCQPANAEFYVDSSDLYLRTDLQLLAEYGVITTPINTYPLRWQAMGSQLSKVEISQLPHALTGAYQRVYQRFLHAQHPSIVGSVHLAQASEAAQFRHFGSDYREARQAGASLSFQTDNFAAQGAMTVAANPADGKNVRPDQSYLALVAGNWAFSAGYVAQWWGPGVDSALHRSTNARPMPSIMLTGHQDRPWLSWLGGWSFQSSLSKMEHERFIPNPLLWSHRFNFRPFHAFEVGLSWTSQLCGEGIQCGFKAFKEVLSSGYACPETLPNCQLDSQSKKGNQMAGIDLQYRALWFGHPFSFYYERTCEDSGGSGPLDIADCAALAGAHSWLPWAQPQLKLLIEYADTMVACGTDRKAYNCFYEHSTYRSGSRYYQRSLGSTYDSDARTWVLGVVSQFADESALYATVRNIKLNHDGVTIDTSWTPTINKQKIVQLDLNYQQPLWYGTLKVGASTAHIQLPAAAKQRQHTFYWGYVYHFSA